jgi:hypothetical protein
MTWPGALDFFHADEITRIEDAETGAVLYELADE